MSIRSVKDYSLNYSYRNLTKKIMSRAHHLNLISSLKERNLANIIATYEFFMNYANSADNLVGMSEMYKKALDYNSIEYKNSLNRGGKFNKKLFDIDLKNVIIFNNPKDDVELPLKAAYLGNLQQLKDLAKDKELDLNHCYDNSRLNVLHYAAKGGHLDIVIYLTNELGFDLDIEVLNCAAKSSNLELVKYLLEKGLIPKPNEDAAKEVLNCAAGSGNLTFLKYLVETKNIKPIYDNNWDNALHIASQKGYLDIVKYLIDNNIVNPLFESEFGQNVLHLGILSNNSEIVKYLLEEKKLQLLNSLDSFNQDCLLFAAKMGNLDLVKYFIETYHLIPIRNTCFETPLHYAALSGNLDLVKYFIEAYNRDQNLYINLNPYSIALSNKTLLDYAKESKNKELIDYLTNNFDFIDSISDDDES